MEALYDAESFGSVRIAQCNMSYFIPPVVQAAAAFKLSWAYPLRSTGPRMLPPGDIGVGLR
jgi:hypothetical protein